MLGNRRERAGGHGMPQMVKEGLMRCQPLRDLLVNICSKFNQTCGLCGGTADNTYSLCSGCEEDLPWAGPACSHCALPLVFEGPACPACQWRPPPFERVEAPWTYDFPLDAAIKRFKHQGDRPLGRLLAERLSAFLAYRLDDDLPRPSQLLPVPMSPRRLRARGFNQAQLLAQWLSRGLAIPVGSNILVRTRETPSQQGLDLAARQQNLQGAFGLAPGAMVTDKHVAIVDDVMTTGATAQALAKVLKQAGARRVDVYCLARTPAPACA
jgi:ComF family protein